MLVSEFIDRTGYQPTAEEYDEIEQAYYVFDGDKDAFCKAWCREHPEKAGSLTAKIKENDRVGKVFDKLVRHIRTYSKRKDFDRDMLYYMNYRDRSMHVDFVCRKTGARNHVELRNHYFFGMDRDGTYPKYDGITSEDNLVTSMKFKFNVFSE